MKICSAVLNNPYFIVIQYITFKKFCKFDYEFIVFNDAKEFPDSTNNYDINVRKQISDLCNDLNIKCINIPNSHQIDTNTYHYSARASDSMNYIMKYISENKDQYFIFDSDMFLIDNFDINKYIKYNCAILLQSRFENTVHYMWNGLVYLDANRIHDVETINWNCAYLLDTGGMTKDWLLSQNKYETFPLVEDLRYNKNLDYHKNGIYFLKHLWSCTWDINEIPYSIKKNPELFKFIQSDNRNVDNKYFSEIYEDVIFHYRAGGNWRGEGNNLHLDNSKKLLNIMYEYCKTI